MSDKILMGTMNYYTCPFRVGSHHYAANFARRGFDVAYLSKPLSPWHVLLAPNRERTDRYAIWKTQGITVDGVWSYVPMASLTPSHAPLLRSRTCLNHWHRLTCPNLLSVLKERGFDRVKVLWFDNPAFAFLLDTIAHEKSVLRVADNLQGFSNAWPALIDAETQLLRRVNRVVYTARNLRRELATRADESKMTLVPNGVDFEFFRTADTSFPEEFRDLPEPRIIYVGAIDTWFDFDLLAESARRLPACSFVLIGLARTSTARLQGIKNIFLLGPQPYARVPQFLTHSQVGIIPFVRNELVEYVNPIKLYEYMACGLPVVCTAWEEVRALNSPALLAENADQFTAGIERAIAHPVDSSGLIAYARENDWHQRVRQVLDLLDLGTDRS